MDAGNLIHMVNQIAANLARETDPARAVAAHIVQFWDPRMKAAIRAADQSTLSPIAAEAVAHLQVEPAP
ncbi:MAG: formate dehydrogenase subunit delta [Novosphingobium sp.]